MSEGEAVVAPPRTADELRALVGSRSLLSLLAWRAAEKPERVFSRVGEDRAATFGQIAALAVTVSDALATRGVGPGSRVLVRIGNDERFLACLAAIWELGATAVPMHPAASANDLSGAAVALTLDAVCCDVGDSVARTSGLATVLVARIEPDLAPARPLRVPDVGGNETALILLTSGSTGAPKGVLLSHDNAWSNMRATVSAFRADVSPRPLSDSERPPNLLANPVSHTAGIVRLLFALYVGRAVVLVPKFDAALVKRLLDTYGIDNLTINPAMLRMLLDGLPAGADLGRVKYVSSGTAPLTDALREEFEARFGVPVLQAYGQTEAFGGIAIENVRDVLAGRRRPGSVGRPLPGVELRLLAPDGTDVTPGESGEIVVRSKSSSSAYAGSATALLSADGWLRTGDLGRLDDEGYLYITGRLKNIIICGGFNIAPEEVEAALELDDAVTEAVVVSVADDRLGELPVAFVTGSGEEDRILAAAGARLAPYKRPRRVAVVNAFPRVPNGKVDRGEVARMAAALFAEEPPR
ncbi:class I adenylate-forming enzyme family protein [Amycolatopsis rhabdoformis]|uniref:Class I adenylate-forming enzyme family protein n=1 Tax=Amycolatopsis rhabdoformis TaxID=1448059 RepID=A0ABZ1IEI2_9PSEU|nr:class I adenylate-forming enzyme family protein [Amycolatopsis rhabdoformis]WSE32563.1 class I adenylate-forming enzyme family protein [Amycolatopsis rhabdoformis]